MNTSREDLIELSGYAWQRLRRRMAGLTDAEYSWEPVPDCRTVRPMPDGTFASDGPVAAGDTRVFTTLAWRLCHIVDFLRAERIGPWLGQDAPPPRDRRSDAGNASEILTYLDQAYACWHDILLGTTEESLRRTIGPVGGRYAESTRRSFVLHILDGLIHHGAEAALLRDLYAASKT